MLASSMRGTPLAPRRAGAAPRRAPPARPACAARRAAAAPRGPAAWAPAPQRPLRADALIPTATSPSSAHSAPVAAASSNAAAAAATAAAAAAPAPAYPPAFTARRLLTFAGIVLGYSSFYLTRNSLTYTAPAMVADAALGLSMTDVGALTSIFPIMYGVSKFASGVLGSRTSPRALLAGGLAATALMNLAFGFSNTMMAFVFFWSVNGMLQGLGAPGCARILTGWFAAGERGTYWGMWNIAHNLGGFLAPLLAGTAAKLYGWRFGMFAPGAVGLAMALLVAFAVRDSPEAAGFPPVEAPAAVEAAEAASAAGSPAAEPLAPEKEESLVDLLVNDVLKNPYVVGLALTYFFVYVVRQGVTSWFVFYLMQVKGVADAGAASLRVSGLELGGLLGSLLAGRLSDALVARAPPGAGTVGMRVRVIIGYTFGIALSLLAFAAAPASATWAQWASVFAIGFFLYGPQMMIGLCGAELVRPESVGASQGFLGWVAYLGAANAGIPLSFVVRDYGWGAYFGALLAACGVAVALLAPMVRAKSYAQAAAERRAAAA